MSTLNIRINEKDLSKLTKDYDFFRKFEFHQSKAIKIKVILMLNENKPYKEIMLTTGVARSTIPYYAHLYIDNKSFYLINKRQSKLDKRKYDIKEILTKNPPNSLSDACNILKDKLGINCGKTTMKEFLDRNDMKSLIRKQN